MPVAQPSPTAQHKNYLRATLRRARKNRLSSSANDVEGFTRNITTLIRSYPTGSTIAAYLPLPTEPPITEALTWAHQAGYRVLVPAVRPHRQLAWLSWAPSVPSTRNSLGILEPKGADLGSEAFFTADLKLIPALALDISGRRLGQGGGFYDALLTQLPQGRETIGVIYDRELLDGLPADPWDATLTHVLTESHYRKLAG